MIPEAVQLAEALRAGKKRQGLSGTQIAEQIERLTGSRPSLMWISRRLRGQTPMLRVSSELFAFADILGVDIVDLIADALFPDEKPSVGGAHRYRTGIEAEYRRRVAFEQDWTEALEIDRQMVAAGDAR